MMEIALTPKILVPPKIGGHRLNSFEPNGKSGPDDTQSFLGYVLST